MKILKSIKAFLPALLLCLCIVGCSNESKPPSELIIGNWEYRNQAWCEFYDDSTCIIGGMAGEYKIDEDNSITLTVYGTEDPMRFEWASGPEGADIKHWYITEDTLYINGMQYPKITDDENSSSQSSDTLNTGSSESSENSENSDSSSETNS